MCDIQKLCLVPGRNSNFSYHIPFVTRRDTKRSILSHQDSIFYKVTHMYHNWQCLLIQLNQICILYLMYNHLSSFPFTRQLVTILRPGHRPVYNMYKAQVNQPVSQRTGVTGLHLFDSIPKPKSPRLMRIKSSPPNRGLKLVRRMCDTYQRHATFLFHPHPGRHPSPFA